jgi:hypothetical protein
LNQLPAERPESDGAPAHSGAATVHRLDLSLPGPASHRRRGRRGRWLPVAAGGAALLAAAGIAFVGTGRVSPEVLVSLPDSDGAAAADDETSPSPAATPHGSGPGTRPQTPARSGPVTDASRAPAGQEPERVPSSRAAASSAASAAEAGGAGRPASPRTSATPAATPRPGGSGPASLRRGDRGAAVTEMQRKLYRIGLYHGYRYGTFDADTAAAVTTFQRWDGVAGDPPGVYGPATRRALDRWAP